MHVDEIIQRIVLYMIVRYNFIRRPRQKFGTCSVHEPIDTFANALQYCLGFAQIVIPLIFLPLQNTIRRVTNAAVLNFIYFSNKQVRKH